MNFKEFLLQEGVYDPGIFKAFFMAGGPGSGKSFISQNTFAGTGLKSVNMDPAFEAALRKANLSAKMPDEEAYFRDIIRNNAKGTTKRQLDTYVTGRLGLVIDATGRDYGRISAEYNQLHSLGYDCYMIFVNTTLPVALERNKIRSRQIPEYIVKKSWEGVQSNIGKLQRLFGLQNFIVVDNNRSDKELVSQTLQNCDRLVRRYMRQPIKSYLAKTWMTKEKMYRNKLNESIIDAPRNTYAPGVFDDYETKTPRIKPSVREIVDNQLKEFGKDRVDEFQTRSGIKSSSKSTDKPKKGSNKEAIMIGGKRASITQKKLLKGGWTVKELEAKMKKILEDYAPILNAKQVEGEATEVTEGYTWEDFTLDDEYYSNSDYIANGGPPTLTISNYCDYNGYDSSWCNQEYVDYLNDWYSDDWALKKKFTEWTKESKAIFEKMYGWCWVGNYEWEFCDGQPAPWKMGSLNGKYVTDWDWDDWNTFWNETYNWYYYGEYADDYGDVVTLEEEYGYEDDYDQDYELTLWLADIDNETDCVNWGYYWDKANSACGTEWVDNSGAETTTTTSGEIINYTTGEITQTVTTEENGVKTSETRTGRYTTGNNEDDATASTSGDYTIINRTHGGHTAYVSAETDESADVQIVQDSETQNITLGSDSTKPNITIIQTD